MDTSIKRLLEIAGVNTTQGKSQQLVEGANADLINKIVGVLTPMIAKLEKQGFDADDIERSIDEWFEDLKEQVRPKL